MKEVINFESELFNLSKINPLVTRYKLFIAYPDEPANNYIFSKEVLTNLSPTIRGCPVVAGFMNGEDGSLLGGHEGDYAINQSNRLKPTPTPIPVGFCAYDIDPWFELYQKREYLTTFIYIWDGRFPELENLSERKIFQSMEVAVDDKQEGSYKIVQEAWAIGLCLLENVDPAFKNSHIELFSKSDNKIQVETDKLKNEFEHFTDKYADLDFSIPKKVKTNVQLGLDLHSEYGHGGTTVAISLARYLIKNTNIVPEKIRKISSYFSRHTGEDLGEEDSNKYISWQLYGGDEGYKWSTKIVDEMNKIDETKLSYMSLNKEGEILIKKFSVDEDKLGKSSAIDIKNDKESSAAGEWSDPGATLLNKLLEASNHTSLVDEAYLVIDGSNSDNLSTDDVHYPHHVIKDEDLVVHYRGVQAALSRARSQGLTGEPISHLKRHYKELGLNMDNFAEFDLTEEDYNYMFADEKEKEEGDKVSIEFSLNSDQVREILRNALSEYKYTCGDYEYNKFYVETYDDTYVYVYDCEDGKCYGITYQLEDMIATIDIESKKLVIGGGFEFVDENKGEGAEMSSNANVDNGAMEALNENAAEQNKKLADEQLEVDDKDKVIAGLQEEMSKMKDDMDVYMKENEELKTYKADIEEQNKNFEVEATLKEVMSVLPEEEVEACRTSAKEFSLENIGGWKNEVQAKAFKFSKGIPDKEPFVRMPFVENKPKTEKKGLWD